VHDWLRQRHAKLLEMPDWSEEELSQMGPNAKRDIRRALAARKQLRERLSYRGGKDDVQIDSVYAVFRDLIKPWEA
jgi:hypothetical protein